MSNDNYKIFWNEAISQLMNEGKITEEEYDIWFRNTSFIRVENHIFFFSVPSKFYRDQLIERYLKLLQNKFYELIGDKDIKIEFNVQTLKTAPAENSPNKKKPQSVKPHKKENPPAEIKPHKLLRDDYIFERYVIGENNSFATNAAKVISENPGRQYNPFLIYGGVGLGKTHLMQAIGNGIYQSTPDKKVVYITAETFVNEFIQSIRMKTQNQFKTKYRKIDVLLIDDIHDFHSKKETQEELFHTFNALYDAKKQLVFTCDRPASELKDFTARLKSRFELGLNVDLQPPNFETRYAILKNKLDSINTHIPDEVIEFIAQNVTTNIRDLESSLTKLVAYADLVTKEITLEVAKRQIKGSYINNSNSSTIMNRVQKVVADYFNISVADMKAKKRTKMIANPRQIAMYIIREITDFSTTEIGLEFGGRDHTTVMYSHQKIKDNMKSNPTLEPLLSHLIQTVKESE